MTPSLVHERAFDQLLVAVHDVARARLDMVLAQAYRAQLAGMITEGHGERLHVAAQHRRDILAARQRLRHTTSINLSRQCPRSADHRASRERRRTIGGSAVMPPNLRGLYTEGQRSVLGIIAGEVKRQGFCDLPIDQIAALAGVCRTTVQTSLHEAKRQDHIRVTARPQQGRKHLPHIITIASKEWAAWIKRGPTAHRSIGSNSPILVSPTKRQEAYEKGSRATFREFAEGCGAPEQRQIESGGGWSSTSRGARGPAGGPRREIFPK